jgi:hypothetical protein
MPEPIGVTNIREVRGQDGSTRYEITGGKRGEGETSFFVPKQAFHELEAKGKQEMQETLKRQIETSLQSRKENFNNI